MIYRDFITDLLHDKLTIMAFGTFAAIELNPADLLRTNTPEARWFTNIIFALAVASFLMRLWRRSIEIRMKNIELHRQELELKEEEIAHQAIQRQARREQEMEETAGSQKKI